MGKKTIGGPMRRFLARGRAPTRRSSGQWESADRDPGRETQRHYFPLTQNPASPVRKPGRAFANFRAEANLPSVASGYLFPYRYCGLGIFAAPTLTVARRAPKHKNPAQIQRPVSTVQSSSTRSDKSRIVTSDCASKR